MDPAVKTLDAPVTPSVVMCGENVIAVGNSGTGKTHGPWAGAGRLPAGIVCGFHGPRDDGGPCLAGPGSWLRARNCLRVFSQRYERAPSW